MFKEKLILRIKIIKMLIWTKILNFFQNNIKIFLVDRKIKTLVLLRKIWTKLILKIKILNQTLTI